MSDESKQNESMEEEVRQSEVNEKDSGDEVKSSHAEREEDPTADQGDAGTSTSNEQGAEAPDELGKLKLSLAEEQNKYLRLYAEFENFRRRNAKERLELISSASADLMKEMLPVMDDFQRAIASNKTIDDIDAVKHGFELLHQKMQKILESKGLKPIESKGEAFDAEIHEAVAQVPVEKAEEKGIIIDEVEKGYLLNDKIIRHPKVVVGS